KKEMIAWLRQKSRTYLFSGSPAPAALRAVQSGLEKLQIGAPDLAELARKTDFFRDGLEKAGFDIVPSIHPMVSVLVKDAIIAQQFTNRLYQNGIYVLGYCYPVVPRGSARVRAQISAKHTQKQLQEALSIFKEAGQHLNVLK